MGLAVHYLISKSCPSFGGPRKIDKVGATATPQLPTRIPARKSRLQDALTTCWGSIYFAAAVASECAGRAPQVRLAVRAPSGRSAAASGSRPPEIVEDSHYAAAEISFRRDESLAAASERSVKMPHPVMTTWCSGSRFLRNSCIRAE